MLLICQSKFCLENLWQWHFFYMLHRSFRWKEHHVLPVSLVQAITLITFIWKVYVSNLKRGAAYPDRFSWFFFVPPSSCRKTALNFAGFEVLATVVMKSSSFWIIQLCSMLKVKWCLGACGLLIQGQRTRHTGNENGAESKQGPVWNDDSRWPLIHSISCSLFTNIRCYRLWINEHRR